MAKSASFAESSLIAKAWWRRPAAVTTLDVARSIRTQSTKFCPFIAGHPTGLRLERKFWDFLHETAFEYQVLVTELVEAINRGKGMKTLASAIRIFVAHHYRNAAS